MDHRSLRTLLNNPQGKRQSSKFIHWKERLAEFDYNMDYLLGKSNKVADFVSRLQQSEEKEPNFPVHGICMEELRRSSEEDGIFKLTRQYLKKDWSHGVEITSDIAPYIKSQKSLRWMDVSPKIKKASAI